jgi:CheY-like chemotaxis protein
MAKRILDVGQCGPDHHAIRRLLEPRFGAEVVQAHGPSDALAHLRREKFDLVLVNRKLDADYSDGLPIIQAIKADPAIASVPVMLVSNYEDAQQAAVAAGAVEGFGKAQLGHAETLEKLRAALGEGGNR